MSDDYEQPFIEDGSQFGISQSTFAEMDPAEQRELMISWFFQNFEDPVNQTPWDSETKEYMYIWVAPTTRATKYMISLVSLFLRL